MFAGRRNDILQRLPAGLAAKILSSYQLPGKLISPSPEHFFDLSQISLPIMATLADELLNDFEDSGSEDGNRQNAFLGDDPDQPKEAALQDEGLDIQTTMELDGDEEEEEPGALDLDDMPDEEETKAKVEKMKLANVDDVTTIATLQALLNPVLEVITSSLALILNLSQRALRLHRQSRPDLSASCAENRPFPVHTPRNACWCRRRQSRIQNCHGSKPAVPKN